MGDRVVDFGLKVYKVLMIGVVVSRVSISNKI